MLTFDNFKQIFEKASSRPYFVIYHGSSKGRRVGNNFDAETPDIKTSLAELSEIVELYGPGVYTVEQKKTPTASQGDIHVFRYGDAEEPANVGRSVQPAQAQSPGAFFNGLDARFFLNQTFQYQSELANAQMALLKKEMEMEMLKREMKEKDTHQDTGDKIMGFFEKNPRVVDRVFDVLTGTPATASVGRLKSETPIPQDDEDGDDDDFVYENGRIDLNSLFDAAHRIQCKIPDLHVNEILDRLASFVEANTDQARNLINMLPNE